MSIRGADAELPQAPWLVFRLREHLYVAGAKLLVERVQSLDSQIDEVSVVSQLTGGFLVGTLTEPHLEVASRQKTPTIGAIAEVTAEPEHVDIELGGFLKV